MPAEPTKSMFLIKSLEKILSDKDIKRSHNKELRHECIKAIEDIKRTQDYNCESSSVLPHISGKNIFYAEDYFLPFQLACKSRSSKTIITAIDGIQKLIAYGHINGRCIDPLHDINSVNLSVEKSPKDELGNGPFSLLTPVQGWEYKNNKMIDRIIRVVCESMTSEVANEDIFLQILKALLTIITSPNCEVHESSLLLAIRTCYNIHLISKNLVNQTTAKATLNQMVSVIFARMEAHDSEHCLKHCGLLANQNYCAKTPKINNNGIEENGVAQEVYDENEDHRQFMEDEIEIEVSNLVNDMLERLEHSENTIIHEFSPNPDYFMQQHTSMANNSSNNHNNIDSQKPIGNNNNIDNETQFYRCKVAYTLRRDAFLVFRALCRLALKNVNAPPVAPNCVEDMNKLSSRNYKQQISQHRQNMIRSKAMSLQLLHSVIESAGPVFKSQESAFKFGVCYHVMAAILPYFPVINTPQGVPFPINTSAVQHEEMGSFNTSNSAVTCNENGQTSLSNEEINENLKLFEICVNVFSSAVKIFKKNMKLQIEIFFKEIYLNVLENPFSSEFKMVVLNSLYSFCENPQNIIDLYVNYDCDLTATNIFARLVTALSKIICSYQSIDLYNQANSGTITFASFLLPPPAPEDTWETMGEHQSPLRVKGLQCIVAIGCCMSLWCTDLHDKDRQMQIQENTGRNLSPYPVSKNPINSNLASNNIPNNEEVQAYPEDYDDGNSAPTLNLQKNSTRPANFKKTGRRLFNINTRADSFKTGTVSSNLAAYTPQYDDDFVPSLTKFDEDPTAGTQQHFDDVDRFQGDHPAKYENLKQIKETIETGIEMFKKKPDKGIAYLQRNTNLIGSTAQDVAKFLFNELRLDKTAVGDYLGDNDDFHKEVMYAYIDLMDFKGKAFVQALRYFLERFKLPGEAQKVDRLMQKFASRYVETTNYGNGVFQSADSAYVLAFSIIMLTTDLHNPQVKRKMTKAEYIRINKSSSDQKDLPEAYLSQIYDEIAEQRINLKDKMIHDEDIGKERSNEFTSAIYIEHVRPMFKIAWTPMLAAYSVCLQDCDNMEIVTLCLEGMKYAIRIACIFQLELERNAFIQALSHFTLLHLANPTHSAHHHTNRELSNNYNNGMGTSNDFYHYNAHGALTNTSIMSTGGHTGHPSFTAFIPAPTTTLITPKNLATIHAFISIAETEGNYLGTSWFDFLKCISQLELAKIIVASTPYMPLQSEDTRVHSPNSENYFASENLHYSNLQLNLSPSTQTHDVTLNGLVSSGTNVDETSSQVSSTSYMSTSIAASQNRSNSNIINNKEQAPKSFLLASKLKSTLTGSNSHSSIRSSSNIPHPTQQLNVQSRNNPLNTSFLNSPITPSNVNINIGADTTKQNLLVKVDKIFANSINLDGEAICDFVRALCKVSTEELESAANLYNAVSAAQQAAKIAAENKRKSARFWKKHAAQNLLLSEELSRVRLYSLQKIVEISYYNMTRIRLQWSKIWDILGPHFNKVGCHPNEAVAFFALDSLRQLSTKFLEKGELSNFRFQKDFLRPFEYIIKNNRSLNVADMTVRCIDQMIRAQAHNIKSGWKNIFSIFQIVASNFHDQYMVEMAFNSLIYIITELSEPQCDFAHNLIDSFQNMVKCLAEFACCYNETLQHTLSQLSVNSSVSMSNSYPDTLQSVSSTSNQLNRAELFSMKSHNTANAMDINMEAIRLMRICADYIHQNPLAFKEFSCEELNVCEDDYPWVKGWFPILFELSCVINRCSLDIRTRALTIMFDILKSYGHEFSPHWWKDFFRVLFRIFDNFKIPNAKSEKSEWMNTTCNHALYAIVDIFSQFYEPLCTTLLQDFYQQLKWCLKQGNEPLARAALNCLENMIMSNGIKFGVKEWDHSCNVIVQIFCETLPTELFNQNIMSGNLTSPHKSFKEDPNSHRGVATNFSDVDSPFISRRGSTPSDNDDTGKDDHQFERKGSTTSINNVEYQKITIQCVIQLELIRCVDRIVFYKHPEELLLQNASSNAGGNHIEARKNKIDRHFYGVKPPATSLVDQNAYDIASQQSTSSSTRCMTYGGGRNNTGPHIFPYTAHNHSSHTFNSQTAGQGLTPPTYNFYGPHSDITGPNNSALSLSHYKRILFYECLTSRQSLHLAMDFLLKSHRFALKFNSDTSLRETLHKINFKGRAKPNLILQETASLELFINILFTLYEDDSKQNQCHFVREKLIIHLIESLKYFIQLETKSHRDSWNGIIRLLLTKLLVIKDPKFRMLVIPIYPYVCELLTIVFEAEIKSLLRSLFLKIGTCSSSMSTPKNAAPNLLDEGNPDTQHQHLNIPTNIDLASDINSPTRLI